MTPDANWAQNENSALLCNSTIASASNTKYNLLVIKQESILFKHWVVPI